MKIPNWAVPVLLRLLSLAGLTSAAGDKALTVGFALSSSNPATGTFPTVGLSQPQPQSLSLDLDFFVHVASHEFKVPIMPLHLLGKKSWNVYNTDNIAKVKQDEAKARAKEEAEEQRMQEIDAERRIQILRGEVPTPLAIEEVPSDSNAAGKRERRDHGSGRESKRRKRAGENDTDFEMRMAETQSISADANRQLVLRKDSSAPVVDHKGHIDLFPQDRRHEKNPEAEKEAAKKKKEYEDQYTMRFSNAAGMRTGLDAPWYSKPTTSTKLVEDIPDINVWGNEDPRRKEREAARLVSNDPLAMMKAGAKQVRQVKQERQQWREEKERELRDLEREEASKKRKRRRRDDSDEDDLDGFRLDDEKPRRRERSRERGSSRRDRRRDRSRERRHHRKESTRSSRRDEDRERYRHGHRD